MRRLAETRGMRNGLVAKVGRCELCGTSEKDSRWRPLFLNSLACHEILNGPLRDKVLDEPACLIVACSHCNLGPLNCKGDYPLARQLAIIKAKAPDRYDRERVLELRNPNAMSFVTEEEVDYWLRRDNP